MITPSPRGFTLIETLVAITVLVIALVGPFQMVQQALMSSYIARDELIASSLAEEGIEYVRMMRDSNYLYSLAHPSSPKGWLEGLDGSSGPNCLASAGCIVELYSASASACGSSCPALNTSASDGRYTHSAGTASRFTRKVTLTQITATEVMVTVTVTWPRGTTTHTVTVTDHLHNWL